MRQIITWEAKQLKMLSETQKEPVIAFIFINETMRQGLTGFFDLFAKDIKNADIINAFKALSISDKYINVIEDKEIYEKIVDHVRQYHLEFFEYK